MASRSTDDLTWYMQEKFTLFKIEMARMGISFIVTCTARTVQEQMALYAQGRNPLAHVNKMRALAGLPPLRDESDNRKVTWTLNSKHLIDLEDGNPDNNKARAFDIAIMDGKNVSWDLKVDVNRDQIPDYRQAGKIGESVGLKWGGRFKSPDMPHFEDQW